MVTFRKASLTRLIIEQHSSFSPVQPIRLIRVIRGLNSALCDLDVQFEELTLIKPAHDLPDLGDRLRIGVN
jgi:hypothetical protein